MNFLINQIIILIFLIIFHDFRVIFLFDLIIINHI